MAASAAKAAAKVRYIGRRSRNFGRPLWEILLNLKDFGAGRLVIRSKYERYPEPTYYRILSAEPHVFEYPANMKGIVMVEPTFRGRTLAPFDLGSVAHFDDYRLLHKHEEQEYTDRGPAYLEPTQILPKFGTLPPVWQEVLKREKGRELTQDERQMKMLYRLGETQLIRIAEEGETPSYEIPSGGQIPRHMSLYEGVVWTRQQSDENPKSS